MKENKNESGNFIITLTKVNTFVKQLEIFYLHIKSSSWKSLAAIAKQGMRDDPRV